MSNERYQDVRDALPKTLPPITKREAAKAAKQLYLKFGKLDNGTQFRGSYLTRRCWAATKPTVGHWKGWGRLVHDVSHDIFRRIYPHKMPHDPLHSRYEADVARYVAQSGWLDGTLKPKVPVKPTKDEARAKKLALTEAAIKRWETKAKRAATALRKLRQKHKRLSV